MTRFSQRVGAKPPFSSGLNEASKELRTRLWNLFYPIVIPDGESADWGTYQANAKVIWNHLHWTTDKIPHYASDGRKELKDYWFSSEWASFFDLFERCVQILADEQRRLYREPAKLYDTVNSVLEQQGCAYRFISEVLAPITNPLEMAQVKTASQCAIESVSTHITEALRQLPPNPEASPRNSVNESISAVEAALKHLTGQPAATLGEGLKFFEKKYGPLHASIRRGLDQFYAFTNGPDGIRHALVDDAAEVTVDDARFMVVTCSAFANYLVALASA